MDTQKLILAGIIFIASPLHAQGNFNVGVGVGGFGGGGIGGGFFGAAQVGAPMFGFGNGANFAGIAQSCMPQWQQFPQFPAMPAMPIPPIGPGAFNPGMFGPGFPGGGGGFNSFPGTGLPPRMINLPPLVLSQNVLVSPHVAFANQSWGPGFASFPAPGFAQFPNCIPCAAGLPPLVYGPVPGGPALTNTACGGLYNTCGGAGGGVQAQQIIDMRPRNEWDKDDTAAIVAANGMALGLQTTNVFPIAYPRNTPMISSPTWYNTGTRDFNLVPRSHGP